MTTEIWPRTVRLPVQLLKGSWSLLDGAALPLIKEGAIGDLVVPLDSLVKYEDRQRWTLERRHEMYPANTSLWARVRAQGGGLISAKGCVEHRIRPGEPVSAVEIQLKAPLLVVLRPGKTGLLDECLCWIPALNAEADSLNQACTKISEKYETHRRSHTGNVYRCVFQLDGKYLKPLESRRIQAEVEAATNPT